MATNETCSIELTADEALVLFEFLQRFSDTDVLQIEDPAERQVLWGLGGMLEKQLVAPFRPNYADLLAKARARLRDED